MSEDLRRFHRVAWYDNVDVETNGNPRTILPLWDYGWLDHERIELNISDDPRQLIDEYINSDSFKTTFLSPNNQFDPSSHGPFNAESFTVDEYIAASSDSILNEIDELRISGPIQDSPTEEQWLAVESLVRNVISRNEWFFRLRLTEADAQGTRAHEAGFIHLLFREYLFGKPDGVYVERLVFGYD